MPTLPEIGETERALAVRAEDAASHLPAVLSSQNEFETAGETLRQLQTLSKTIEDKRVELTAPVLEAKRRLDDFFRGPAARVKLAIDQVKGLMLGYTREQEAIRQAEERRLRAIEEKKAEKERERLLAKAAKLKGPGTQVQKVALREQAANTTAVDVRVESKVEMVKGQSVRLNYKARVVDFAKLPDEYKLADTVKLGEIARAGKGNWPLIPGVEFYSESVLAARGS